MDSKQIQEISPDGLTYIDDGGKKKFIDFTDCFNTFVKWESHSIFATERMVERAKESRQVGKVSYYGGIDTGEGGPCAMFYDNQFTTFEFSGHEECLEFHQRILDVGWTLFDISD